jgi:hypothetical protein
MDREYSKPPWKVKHVKNSEWTIESEDGYQMFAIVDDKKFGSPDEDVANVHLVSTAPELLEAYMELWDAIENNKVDRDFFYLRKKFRLVTHKALGVK